MISMEVKLVGQKRQKTHPQLFKVQYKFFAWKKEEKFFCLDKFRVKLRIFLQGLTLLNL